MARTVNPQHTQALMDLLTQAPYFSLLGMRFEAMEPGYCRLTLPSPTPATATPSAKIHGGAYSSLIDTAAYWAAYCDMDEDQGYTSLDLSVTNLGMARAGTLVAEGRVIRAGRSICLAEATVKTAEGKLLAHGTSKLMPLAGKQSIRALLAAEGPQTSPPNFSDFPIFSKEATVYARRTDPSGHRQDERGAPAPDPSPPSPAH